MTDETFASLSAFLREEQDATAYIALYKRMDPASLGQGADPLDAALGPVAQLVRRLHEPRGDGTAPGLLTPQLDTQTQRVYAENLQLLLEHSSKKDECWRHEQAAIDAAQRHLTSGSEAGGGGALPILAR